MCSKTTILPFAGPSRDPIARLRKALADCDAVIIGGGAGLSTSAGLTYSGARYAENFSDFRAKYGIPDMYTGGFFPFPTPEEYWGWWCRHIMVNRYVKAPKPVYDRLLDLVREKDYFVLTTNVDHQFQLAGFDKQRLFYTQGDYGLWQCSAPCCQETWDNEEQVRAMYAAQKGMTVPTALVPHCPRCGRPMTMNLRADSTFVQDAGWYEAASRYENFLLRRQGDRILFLELGVGGNTPGIIKYPFWRMTHENLRATYACINLGEAVAPREIAGRSICIDGDIGDVLEQLAAR